MCTYTKIVDAIFTPHTLGEPDGLKSVWEAEGPQRGHGHARRKGSVGHRVVRMRTPVAVRMRAQVARLQEARRHQGLGRVQRHVEAVCLHWPQAPIIRVYMAGSVHQFALIINDRCLVRSQGCFQSDLQGIVSDY